MQAVVEAPPMQNTDEPVSFKVSGKNIPKPVIAFLDALFPDSVRIDEDDDVLEPVEGMDWYKKAKKRIDPAKALKIMRVNAGLTQAQLAKKVGRTTIRLSGVPGPFLCSCQRSWPMRSGHPI